MGKTYNGPLTSLGLYGGPSPVKIKEEIVPFSSFHVFNYGSRQKIRADRVFPFSNSLGLLHSQSFSLSPLLSILSANSLSHDFWGIIIKGGEFSTSNTLGIITLDALNLEGIGQLGLNGEVSYSHLLGIRADKTLPIINLLSVLQNSDIPLTNLQGVIYNGEFLPDGFAHLLSGQEFSLDWGFVRLTHKTWNVPFRGTKWVLPFRGTKWTLQDR